MPAHAIKTNRLGIHLAVCAALAEGPEKEEIRELIEEQDIKTLLLSMRGLKESTGVGEVEYCFSKTEIESLFWYMGADTRSIIDALLLKVGDDEELQRALRNTQNMPEPAE